MEGYLPIHIIPSIPIAGPSSQLGLSDRQPAGLEPPTPFATPVTSVPLYGYPQAFHPAEHPNIGQQEGGNHTNSADHKDHHTPQPLVPDYQHRQYEYLRQHYPIYGSHHPTATPSGLRQRHNPLPRHPHPSLGIHPASDVPGWQDKSPRPGTLEYEVERMSMRSNMDIPWWDMLSKVERSTSNVHNVLLTATAAVTRGLYNAVQESNGTVEWALGFVTLCSSLLCSEAIGFWMRTIYLWRVRYVPERTQQYRALILGTSIYTTMVALASVCMLIASHKQINATPKLVITIPAVVLAVVLSFLHHFIVQKILVRNVIVGSAVLQKAGRRFEEAKKNKKEEEQGGGHLQGQEREDKAAEGYHSGHPDMEF